MKITKLLCIYFISLFVPVLYAQEENTEEQKLLEFVKNINAFSHSYPQEKTYLHFDNTGYFKGEAIWFKAYVVTSENNSLSPLSKVLYVDLLSPEGDIVETKKLKIENGQANGNFILNDRLYAGYYQVRAYTKCMLNFGEEVIFSRVFPVFDQPKEAGNYADKKMSVRGWDIRVEDKRVREDKTKLKDINLFFYPEGGNLISGVGNRVAFKAVNKNGESIETTGKILNESGQEITTFSTMHLGMGNFELYPENGKKYTAQISYEGKEQSFNLPASTPSGYAIRIENMHPTMMSVQVQKATGTANELIGMTFTCRGKVYAFKSFTTDETGQFAIRIPKESFPSGVIQITLFTNEGEVLAQRQAFINHNLFLPIKAVKINSTFEPFAPINLELQTKDTQNNPIESTFSLSVKDAATEVGTNYTDNIMYNMLLSSDLKGYIENPEYYFEDDDNKRKAALDLLMMTQGWTRYQWKQMAGKEPFNVKYGIEDGLIIEGKVLSAIAVKPQENIDVSMWMYSSTGASQQGKCTTDKNGYFNFGLTDIYGTWDLNLYAKKKNKPFNSRITVDRNIEIKPLVYSYYETRPATIRENLDGKSIETEKIVIDEITNPASRLSENKEPITMSYILDEVTVSEKAKFDRKTLATRYGNITYDVMDELDKFRDSGRSETGSITDFLEKTNKYFSLTQDSKGHKFIYKSRPVVFFIDNWSAVSQDNGSASGESTQEGSGIGRNVADLDISEVESITIAENDPQVSLSSVAIYIFTNEDGKRRKEPRGMRYSRFYGYSRPMEFYNPDYSVTRLPDEKDFRRTLYWNPDVKTNKEGTVSIDFFNNETCKEISIDAQGLTGSIPLIFKND